MAREDVCLECWRDFTVDFLHLDCTGEHVVPKAEADELRAWLTGRYEFIVRTGQAIGPVWPHTIKPRGSKRTRSLFR